MKDFTFMAYGREEVRYGRNISSKPVLCRAFIARPDNLGDGWYAVTMRLLPERAAQIYAAAKRKIQDLRCPELSAA